jgi:hypothetical protein
LMTFAHFLGTSKGSGCAFTRRKNAFFPRKCHLNA